ncbi:MAG TPA: NAD(P)/FAD-dependent oxidoreductase [Streptosporangiaceae bacterium]|nr:NAD(P)/FAD-dependent oxidoreductase [Streptosporangiaceae bacterium]
MRRSFHSPLTAMIRAAHAASAEAEVAGAPIDEVTERRAERRRGQRAAVSEAQESYQDAVGRASERGSAGDDRRSQLALAALLRAAGRDVSRRDFAKGAGAAAGIAIAGAAGSRPVAARALARPAADRWPAGGARQPRIVIVGAGAAGLRCAHALWTRAGLACTVYEANTRIGGRVETSRGYFAGGQIAEMHAEFISTEHAATLALASSFGLALDDTSKTPAGTEDTYWFEGTRYSQARLNADWQAFGWRAFHRAVRAVPWPQTHRRHNRTAVRWDHMTIPEWMSEHLPDGTAGAFGRLLLADVVAEYGADPAEQSALNLTMLLGYDDSAGGAGYQPRRSPVLAGSDERWHLTGGNDQLITGLAGRLPPGTIRTGHVLLAVRKNASGAFTCTFGCDGSTRDVIADQLVLACPFSSLRHADLSRAGFSPLKRRAIESLGMGSNGKIIMQFAGRPWVRDGYTGNLIAGNGANSAWEANYQAGGYRAPASVLVDYPGGSGTLGILRRYGITRHEGVPPARLVSDTLDHLEPIFPGATAAYSGLAWYHFGTNDPYVRGAYSYWRPGQYTGFSGYEGAAEGNAHFCGEHTSQNFQGYLEGAITTGLRAAREVERAVRR